MGKFNFSKWMKKKTAAKNEQRQDADKPVGGQPAAGASQQAAGIDKPQAAAANDNGAKAPAAVGDNPPANDRNIYDALEVFINAMRTFTIGVIEKNFPGRPWNETFVKTLDSKQQKM